MRGNCRCFLCFYSVNVNSHHKSVCSVLAITFWKKIISSCGLRQGAARGEKTEKTRDETRGKLTLENEARDEARVTHMK